MTQEDRSDAEQAVTAAVKPRPTSYYLPEDGGFVPTRLSGSPWQGDAQNGVALGLLMAHTLEQQPRAQGVQLARFTLDILRPAPAALTRVDWRVAREGRRVRLLEGELEAGGLASARATALFVAPDGEPPPAQPPRPPLISPDEAPLTPINPRDTGLDTRLISRGAFDPSGERTRQSVWVRVKADVIPGTHASTIACAIAAADTGGVSLGDYGRNWNFPNLDIAVHFARAPRGEWVHIEAEPMILGNGVAVIDQQLSDREGRFARSHQVLFLSPRQRSAA